VSEYDDVVMPKGLKIKEIPLSYCQWLFDNCDLKGYFLGAIEERLGVKKERKKREEFSVARWFNKLATEFHPDMNGGDRRPMQIIERAREVLLEQLTNKR